MIGITDSNQKIITNGLVLHLDAAQRRSYPTTGTTWTDLSGNANNGTLTNGPTYDSGNGGSIVFDGVNDYVNNGDILNFERTNSFSINTWVNITSLSTFRVLVSKMNASFRGYSLTVEADGLIAFILRNTPTTNSLLVRTATNLIVVNLWNNITVTYNGNSLSTGVNFYINSVSYPIVTITNNTLTQTTLNTSPLNIGARTANNDGYISGDIAITQIYNRALSATEVLQNYNATKSRFGL